MSSQEDPITESAKAVQEVAKTGGKAIDAGRELGGFVSRFIEGPLEQGMGIVEDRLRFMRWERKLRLMARANQLMQEHGIQGPSRPLPLKLVVPLLEGASMEDDDYLQDLWARLLVNAADAESGVDLQRAYISILEGITPLEAKILESVYSVPETINSQHNGIYTSPLPGDTSEVTDEGRANMPAPSSDIQLALANLVRLGCITWAKSFGGGEVYGAVHPTLLGKRFVEACRVPRGQVLG